MPQNLLDDKLNQYFDDMDHIAFHYTTIKSAKKIFKSDKIRLFRHDRKNDPQELTYAINILKKHSKEKENLSDCLIKAYKFIFNNNVDIYLYFSSFLLKDDYLPAWRYYGDNGKGIAIGINQTKLLDNTPKLVSCDVVYNETESKQILDEINDICRTYHPTDNHIKTLLSHLLLLLPMFKCDDFKDELEWRIYTIGLWDNSHGNFITKYPPFDKCRKDKLPEFVDYPLKEISHITFGPNCDEKAQEEIKNTLASAGYYPEDILFKESIKLYKQA